MPPTGIIDSMNTTNKLKARNKLIEAIRKLPTNSAREAWARRLGVELYKMQKPQEAKK